MIKDTRLMKVQRDKKPENSKMMIFLLPLEMIKELKSNVK